LKNGTVVFYAADVNNWFVKLYKSFTGCNITHVAIICGGFYYESTIEIKNFKLYFGVIRKELKQIGNNVFIPKRELTIEESDNMNFYLNLMIGSPYNIVKLINILWILPFKWVWNKLNYCPFSNKFLGILCSELVDNAFKYAGIDLLPNNIESLTTPCDISKSDFFGGIK
jgi:hypothetical protein